MHWDPCVSTSHAAQVRDASSLREGHPEAGAGFGMVAPLTRDHRLPRERHRCVCSRARLHLSVRLQPRPLIELQAWPPGCADGAFRQGGAQAELRLLSADTGSQFWVGLLIFSGQQHGSHERAALPASAGSSSGAQNLPPARDIICQSASQLQILDLFRAGGRRR